MFLLVNIPLKLSLSNNNEDEDTLSTFELSVSPTFQMALSVFACAWF